ncbi:MAG: double zinc ribbon domain-containing protein [Gaiellaceae bacterium]
MAWLVDLLLPPRCVCCAASAAVLCAPCRRSLRRPGPPACARCGAPTLWPVERCRECSGRRLAFATAHAAVTYTGAARPLVAAWKEHGLRRAVTLAAELVAETVVPPPADVITSIPPDPERLLRRGHHPAERLARELAACWGLSAAALLVRRGDRLSTRQTELPRAERAANVRGAFVAVTRPPGRVLLVADDSPTGATVAAAAAALTRAGARRVDVVTFARTVRM